MILYHVQKKRCSNQWVPMVDLWGDVPSDFKSTNHGANNDVLLVGANCMCIVAWLTLVLVLLWQRGIARGTSPQHMLGSAPLVPPLDAWRQVTPTGSRQHDHKATLHVIPKEGLVASFHRRTLQLWPTRAWTSRCHPTPC